MKDMLDEAVKHVVLHFATANARAAALSGSSAPVPGMLTWLNDSRRYEYWNGTAWVRLVPHKQRGSTLVSFSSRTSFTRDITFPTPFATDPFVSVWIHSGAGETAQWHARPINATKTGFTLFLFSTTASAWSEVSVRWEAEE
ncbi:H-type lectin domain-containing protein [Streptomyces sp. DH12]|uniref:H-type lectin domain-containing protein n=1 Tax=Streptomyces sp. DH12 TaxID=2857010 RepID=UPI001E45CE2D|nr:H-type lectin domain-containing protein [Streptomyces sp. DH12]